MADEILYMFGKPIRIRDNGDGTFSLAQQMTGRALANDPVAARLTDGVNWADVFRTPAIFKPISAALLGANAIWTPAAGKRFRLMGFLLSFSGAVNAKLQDGATDITGLFYGATGAQVPNPPMGNGYLSATINNVLNLNLSAATAVGGWVWGIEE